MAVERTMASWLSASFAAIGVGLGARALFGTIEPFWIPRAIATLFFVLAIALVLSAERRLCRAIERLSSHKINPASQHGMQVAAYGVVAGAIVLIVAIWFFQD
jgi:putative membrane protein